MCGGQVLIIMVGGKAFAIAPEGQSPTMWAYAIVLGVLSIPIGVIIRLVPDSLCAKLVPEALKRRAHSKIPGVTVSDDDERFNNYPEPLADVHEELAFMKRIKGGRINNLKFAIKHPRETFKYKSPSHSREHSRSNSVSIKMPATPTRENSFGSAVGTPESRKRSRSNRSRSNSALGATTVMAGIIAGSVGAGWSPIDRNGGNGDFGQFPPATRAAPPSPLGATNEDIELQSRQDGQPMSAEPQAAEANGSLSVPQLSVPQPPVRKSS